MFVISQEYTDGNVNYRLYTVFLLKKETPFNQKKTRQIIFFLWVFFCSVFKLVYSHERYD